MSGIKSEHRKWWILAAMGFSLAVVVLDETIVGVALPSITDELNMKVVTAHWIINAYLLVFTGLAAAGGKLLDRVDIKRLFIAGVLMFGLASFGCGYAENALQLIISRSIQGIGAAIIFPGSVALVAMVFAPQQRGLALGIYTSFGSV
ncbi:MAG: MFS transporter, partial [Cyanobacteria bacterium J06638_6]